METSNSTKIYRAGLISSTAGRSMEFNACSFA